VSTYQFTNTWFRDAAKNVWDQFIPQIKPKKILEIGSYEGASACYLIDQLAVEFEIEIHCIDTWEGGIEHQDGGFVEANMNDVESRFKINTQIAIDNTRKKVNLVVHKGLSDDCLAGLISAGKKDYFDFIYIDGSHKAPDVLCDAILGFKLLKVGGHMVFDDYLWSEKLPYGKDLVRCPKPAIDAFTNLFCREVRILPAPLFQIYIQKVAS